MDEIRFSLFDHARDGVAKIQSTSWTAFARDLGPHRFDITDKKRVPMFSPAEYRPGAPRTAANVIRIWFGVLDLDKINQAQLSQVVAQLEGLDAVLYTTWSHTDPDRRARGLWTVRVCVRLSRPIEVNEWSSFWHSFTAHFGGLNDPQCKDPCHPYFGPAAPPGTRPEDCYYIVFQGHPLDVSRLTVQAVGAPVVRGTERISRERLERLAIRWKRSRDSYRSELGEALHKVCKGEPFAESGNRDNILFQLAQDLAKDLPQADPESIAAHFAQSLQVMPGKDMITIDDVVKKLERAAERQASESLAEEMAQLSERKLRIRQAFAHIDPEREHPYTEAELDAIAEKCRCTREELRKRWLIQRGGSFYVLGPEGVYSSPYSDKDVGNAVLRDLAPADSAGVDLWTVGTNGDQVRKGVGSLMAEYGSVAVDTILDMRAQVARYDSTQRLFIEAPCPLRPLTPRFDPDVNTWLELLAGAHFYDVQNWIAHVTDLDLTCAALMLTGPKDTGKSLLAFGLSRLWTTIGPTPLTSAMSDFNDALARCPLTFADETLPKDWRGNGRTSEIREFLSARSRPFKRKHLPESKILGAARLMVAANNEDILSIHEHLTAQDIDAIGDRFYHVRIRQDPAIVNGEKVLDAKGKPVTVVAYFLSLCDTASFIQEDKIARHALWLRDHFPKRKNGRFLIQSPDQGFIHGLATRSGIRSAVCQWLIGYLKSPARIDSRGDFGVMIKDGKLYAQSQTILDTWDLFVKNEMVPPTGKLSQALTELSTRRAHLTKPRGGAAHFREIDTQHLIAWSSQTEFATVDEILEALEKDTETRIRQATQPRPA